MTKFSVLRIVFGLLFCYIYITNSVNAASIIKNLSNNENQNIKRSVLNSGIDSEEPDWSKIKFKEINYKSKETGMTSTELFKKVKKCIEKCSSQNHADWRDNCIAQNCDIY